MQAKLDQTQHSIPPLEIKVQKLEHECSAKDKMLDGWKAWKDRIYESMGFPPQPNLTHNPHGPLYVSDMQNGVITDRNESSGVRNMEHISDSISPMTNFEPLGSR